MSVINICQEIEKVMAHEGVTVDSLCLKGCHSFHQHQLHDAEERYVAMVISYLVFILFDAVENSILSLHFVTLLNLILIIFLLSRTDLA